MNYSEIVNFIWGVANLIRDTFKRGKYQDIILPLTVLRRLDCVLGPTKEDVLQRQGELRGRGLEDLNSQLCRSSGFAFYNTSRYDFALLLADAPNAVQSLAQARYPHLYMLRRMDLRSSCYQYDIWRLNSGLVLGSISLIITLVWRVKGITTTQ